MKKVGIVGAGNVGATLAMRVVEAGLADVALVDIADGRASGKAIDISDTSSIIGYENSITGSADYDILKDSDVVVITAGFPRKPGMSREELISKNKAVIEEVVGNIKKSSPNAVIIVITNPLDIMSYLAFKKGKFHRGKVMGMAGTLDSARFINLISEKLKTPRTGIKTFVLGSHGDTMVPLISRTEVDRRPLKEVMPEETIQALVRRTKNRGAEVVSLLKTASAYYSPSAACFQILKAIKNDTKETLCVSAYLDGEYGLKDIFIGVPAKIGKNGVEEIVEFDLEEKEQKDFRASAQVIQEAIKKFQTGRR